MRFESVSHEEIGGTMKDGNSKKSKLSWSKKLLTKWFSIKSKSEEFQAHEVVHGEESAKNIEHSFSRTRSHRRGSGYLDHPQIINIQKYSIFVSTWNVGGKSPPSNMDLDNWLHSAPPVDIYVLGFQEIVPLNAGNILGAEDNGPTKKWLAIIKKILNNTPGNMGGSGYHTSSPMPDPIVEWNVDFEGSASGKSSSFFHRRSFQTPHHRRMENDILVHQPLLDRRSSISDGVICGHRASDFDPMRWGYRLSDCSSSWRLSDYSSDHYPSDHSPAPQPGNEYLSCRPSDYSWGQRPSDFSSWGLDEEFSVGDSRTNGWDACEIPEHSRYTLVASRQMVGIFLTIWIRSELREHVRNVKISCVGRGLMGYLGNKGSISISMLLHQTSLCFVCSHLTSGQKDGDELRRNADVMEILRKTRFPRVNKLDDEKSPETVLEHDRIFWLGDLNYRVALPFRSAKALIEMQNWKALLDKDQLRIEQRGGRVFEGWKEGRIYFPPTYKYSHNSDSYAGDVTHLKEKRRTPAWCDRILWYGSGLQQLSYVRGESRFSDHRPVLSLFLAEIESVPNSLKKSMSLRPRIEVEELLPDSHGYTELSFFRRG